MNFNVQKKSFRVVSLVATFASSTVFGIAQPEKKVQRDYFLPAISASSQQEAMQPSSQTEAPVVIRKKKVQRVSTRALSYARNTIKSMGGYAAWEVLLPKKLRNRRVVGTLKVIDLASFLTAPLVALLTYRAALAALGLVRTALQDVTYNSGKEKENPFQKPTPSQRPNTPASPQTEQPTNTNIPLVLKVSN